MKEWKEIAEAMNMKFTIRAMRPSWWGLGIPQKTGCKNVLIIREIVPNDPVIDKKALEFSLDLVHELEQRGTLEFASVDVLETGDTANPARADPDAADDADEEFITMYGVTMTLKNKKVGAIRAQRHFSWIVDEDTNLTQIDMFRQRARLIHKREERDVTSAKRRRPDPAAVSACPDPATASSEKSASVTVGTVALKPRQASVVTLTPGPAPQAEAKPAPAAEGSIDMDVTGPDTPAADEGSRRDPSSTAEKATPALIAEIEGVDYDGPDAAKDDDADMDFDPDDWESLKDYATVVAMDTAQWLQQPDPNFGHAFKTMADAMPTSAGWDYDATHKTKIVLCISTFRRTEQLRRALAINLITMWPMRNLISIVLVSFNDEPEGAELRKILNSHFQMALSHGVLRYFEKSEPWDGWHASVGKNTSHRVACGCYPDSVLVNLDGDNTITTRFCEFLVKKADSMINWRPRDPSSGGGVTPPTSVAVILPLAKDELPDVVGITFKNDRSSSTTGRIALGSRVFLTLRGYNQDFYPMGTQDVDLSRRLKAMGHHVHATGPELVGNAIVNHMEHVAKKRRWQCDVKEKIANVNQSKFGSMTWEQMNDHNFKLSKELLSKAHLTANKGKQIGLKCIERTELSTESQRELETPIVVGVSTTRVEPAGVSTTSAASSSQSQPPAAKAAPPRHLLAPLPVPPLPVPVPKHAEVHPLAVYKFQIFTLGCAKIARCAPAVQSAIDMNNAFNMNTKNWRMDELMPWAQTFHFGGSGAS